MRRPLLSLLTERQFSILRLLAEGHTAKEIAAELHTSLTNVNLVLLNIYYKLDLPKDIGNPSVMAAAIFRKEFPTTPILADKIKNYEKRISPHQYGSHARG